MRQFLRSAHFKIAAIIFRVWPDIFLVCDEPVIGSLPNSLSLQAKVVCLGLELGWIKLVVAHCPNGPIEIGHFGVNPSTLRLRVGTKMMRAYRKWLTTLYGPNQIVFTGIFVGSPRALFLQDELGANPHGVPIGYVNYVWP